MTYSTQSKDSEIVFVHKIPVGGKSPQCAREIISGYANMFKIDIVGKETKNIFLPTDSETSVECIWPQTNSTYIPNDKMEFAKVRDVKSPNRGTSQSAGIDFFIPEDFPQTKLHRGDSAFIPSGIKVKVPTGYALIAFNKSGVATKQGLQVGACVVDEDYQGEIHIHVTNVSGKGIDGSTVLNPGDKIMQFILLPVLYAKPIEVKEEDLYDTTTERGTGGFGSTGTK